MSDSSYPHQLSEAAKVYHNSCNAYANFRAADGFIALRVQAPEIMMQFVGNVDFGKDPKGRLFYKSDLKWPTNLSTYTIFYYKNSTPLVVVRVDFYEPDRAGKLIPFARFLANVKGSRLPPFVPGLGQGKWAQLKAATCPMQVSRPPNSTTVNLGSNALYKQVYFPTQAGPRISQIGFLFFTDLAKLRTKPDGHEYCVADYTSERIVFHIEGQPDEVVARYLPTKPMNGIGHGTSRVTWEDIDTEDIPYV